eukprot:TRINITY_DN22469_c0_g1_i1.p1 TRINITY_DN22469_c0_g1~~TRINITY_DN22469_c0_g1_i1.p1  ORF type:complete len:492 (+),score=100.87 TRINITY_DN22469_c0_g1_i1:397-1872(+)
MPSVEAGAGSSDFWRISVLLLLAKAEAVKAPLVLNLVRGIDPSLVHRAVPAFMIPALVRELHHSTLCQEALLLEVRPLAEELAKAAAATASSSLQCSFQVGPAASLASGLGFLGVGKLQHFQSLWEMAATSKLTEACASNQKSSQKSKPSQTGNLWKLACSGSPGPLRLFVQLGWAACVSSSSSSLGVESSSGKVLGYFQALQIESTAGSSLGVQSLIALLKATPPRSTVATPVSQQMRQLALFVKTTAAPSISADAAAAADPWLGATERSILFGAQRRRCQARLLRTFTGHLRHLGAKVELLQVTGNDQNEERDAGGRQKRRRRKSAAAKDIPDTLKVHFQDVDTAPKALLVTVWAKHPLLLSAAATEQGVDEDLGQGCCVNGFEALEWAATASSAGDDRHTLLLLRSDAPSEEVRQAAARFVNRNCETEQTTSRMANFDSSIFSRGASALPAERHCSAGRLGRQGLGLIRTKRIRVQRKKSASNYENGG